ncbi:MAG: helix-turn-helix transcriptional regulator [Methanobrevibacter sp.]|nr:helix-turn-helix transcriptional regulator [Methanobrevibacter sp.]
MNDEETLYEIAFIKASTYRSGIVKALAEYEKTPKNIADELSIRQSNISGTLKELREHNIVYCINPEVKKG